MCSKVSLRHTNKFILFVLVCVFSIFALPASVRAEGDTNLIQDIQVANGSMTPFDKGEYNYTVELESGEQYADVIVVPRDEDTVVEVEGNENPLKAGEKNVITVKAHDLKGHTAEYTLTVSSQSEGSPIQFLQCLNGTLSPQYTSSTRIYYIVLPYSETSAKLDIRLGDESYSAEVVGNEDLPSGERTHVKVNIRNGDDEIIDVYHLYIYRESEVRPAISGDCLLRSLQINGGAIDLNFSATQHYYRVEVPRDATSLDVAAIAENRSNVVQVIGSESMSRQGKTIVSVIVFNPDNPHVGQSVYTLELYRRSLRGTPIYSTFQLIFAVIAGFAIGVAAVFLARYLRNIRREKSGRKVGEKT